MKPSHWETLKKCARMERVEPVPVALIVDSPWIPGFAGISTLDYFFVPEIWLAANLQVARTFPEVIFLPGFWVELGMAAEPSGFGCRVSFYPDRTPLVHPLFTSLEAVQELKIPNPLTDGFMPMILNTYRWAQPRLEEAGYSIKLVAARVAFSHRHPPDGRLRVLDRDQNRAGESSPAVEADHRPQQGLAAGAGRGDRERRGNPAAGRYRRISFTRRLSGVRPPLSGR